jgi:hypothetical protein
MNSRKIAQIGKHEADRDAMKGNPCTALSKEMGRLYQLSYLLTADHKKAKPCFLAGLKAGLAADGVFGEWARSSAKRNTIQKAIAAIRPHPVPEDPLVRSTGSGGDGTLPKIRVERLVMDSVLALEDFERFVFVLSVLERYSGRDCALLLGCSVQEVRNAQPRALEHMADSLRAAFSPAEDRATRLPARAEILCFRTRTADAPVREDGHSDTVEWEFDLQGHLVPLR